METPEPQIVHTIENNYPHTFIRTMREFRPDTYGLVQIDEGGGWPPVPPRREREEYERIFALRTNLHLMPRIEYLPFAINLEEILRTENFLFTINFEEMLRIEHATQLPLATIPAIGIEDIQQRHNFDGNSMPASNVSR